MTVILSLTPSLFIVLVQTRGKLTSEYSRVIKMAHVVNPLDSFSSYRDSRSTESFEAQQDGLKKSSTLYVGNLSFFTTEEQIYELFSRVGPVKRIIMGLDRNTKSPCGFCFVEYYSHSDALDCLRFVSGTKLDERIVRADIDPGFKEGRQYGRGKSGGQVRDEYREDWDPGRGGYGHIKAMQEHQMSLYLDDHDQFGNRQVPIGEGASWDDDDAEDNADAEQAYSRND